jgi:3-oxo-5,6-didehydrosuberyl-CoA/3-oxoadipyl-CoA thiolase
MSASTPTAARSLSATHLRSSDTRYVLTLSTELRERGARYGVLGVCVGSGQGVALVLENPSA